MGKQSNLACMEHGLQISHDRYVLSMEDKMAAGTNVLGTVRIMGETAPFFTRDHFLTADNSRILNNEV